MKLFEHFKRMQERAAHFIEPGEYIALDGIAFQGALGSNKAFVNDMLRMLDGPEQREAEAELDDFLAKHLADREALLTELGAHRKAFETADTALRSEMAENNDLRSRLMASEMAYAKLRGYLEGKLDSQPPVMVPQQRESFHAQMPDGTLGTSSPSWIQGAVDRSNKYWYHR